MLDPKHTRTVAYVHYLPHCSVIFLCHTLSLLFFFAIVLLFAYSCRMPTFSPIDVRFTRALNRVTRFPFTYFLLIFVFSVVIVISMYSCCTNNRRLMRAVEKVTQSVDVFLII